MEILDLYDNDGKKLNKTIIRGETPGNNENIMLSKEKARQRIDGAASLMDAYVIYINKQQEYLNYINEEV